VVGYQFSIPTHVSSEEVLLLESWLKKNDHLYCCCLDAIFSFGLDVILLHVGILCTRLCWLPFVNSKFWGLTNVLFVTWQVMYDASGIRLHAGKQAEVYNNFLRAICTVGSIAFLYCYNLVIGLNVLWRH
jgi:hypothetical protein